MEMAVQMAMETAAMQAVEKAEGSKVAAEVKKIWGLAVGDQVVEVVASQEAAGRLEYRRCDCC